MMLSNSKRWKNRFDWDLLLVGLLAAVTRCALPSSPHPHHPISWVHGRSTGSCISFWMADWGSWGTEKEPFGNIRKGHRREDGDSLVVGLCSSSSGGIDVNFRPLWVLYSSILPPCTHIHTIQNKLLETNAMKGDLCGRLRYALLQVWMLVWFIYTEAYSDWKSWNQDNPLGFHCPPSKEQCPVVNPQQLYKNSHVIFEH